MRAPGTARAEPTNGQSPQGLPIARAAPRGWPIPKDLGPCKTEGQQWTMRNLAPAKAAQAKSARPAWPGYPHQAALWPNYPELSNSS